MNQHPYTFTSTITAATIGKGGAYVVFPYDIRTEFQQGRVKVHAIFDEKISYDGSIVNMGLTNPDGSICYILGVRKDVRTQLNKTIGDVVTVTVTQR